MSTPSSIKLLGVSGSLRKQSYNSGALRSIDGLLPEGMIFEMADLADLPFYNADVEQQGLPDQVKRFRGPKIVSSLSSTRRRKRNFARGSTSGPRNRFLLDIS